MNFLSLTDTQSDANTANYMTKVYAWMLFGMLITVVFAYLGKHFLLDRMMDESLGLIDADTMKNIFFAVIVSQLLTVIVLTALLARISAVVAAILYCAYAAQVGFSLSAITLVYAKADIQFALIVTTVAFAGLSAFGYYTKRNLGFLGTFCIMGLWGVIALLVIGMIVPGFLSDTNQLAIAGASVIIFSGLTAFDTQRIKASLQVSQGDGKQEALKKATVFGALMLYLDFINLFLAILKLKKR